LSVLIFSLAAAPHAKDMALVVKQEGLKVYLDISDFKTPPVKGAEFRIIEQKGKDIINPKTGKNLGKEISKEVKGKITFTGEMYSTGELAQQVNVLGLEAEVDTPRESSAAHNAFAPQRDQKFNEMPIMPAWQSATIEAETKAAAAGNITGAGNELALVFNDNSINIFTMEDGVLKKLSSTPVNPLRNIIALDAADIKGAGRAQLFAVVYDPAETRFTTLVFEYKDGKLEQTDTIQGLVKGIAPYNTPRALYTQNLIPTSGKFKMTTPAKLIYKNGFKPGDKLNASRFESVFGFNVGEFLDNNKQYVIFATPNRKLRVQFDKRSKYIESPAGLDFATTPMRIKFKNDVLRLPLSIALFKNNQGETIVAAVEHKAKLGVLADTFGSYQSAKLHFLKWTGDGFFLQGSADIGGVVYDIIQAPLGQYKNAIIVPYTSTAGFTRVLIFHED